MLLQFYYKAPLNLTSFSSLGEKKLIK